MAQRAQTAAPPPDLSGDRAEALALTPVSHETLQRLDRYVALLLKWQARTNLVAPSTLPQLWTRHISDSVQLLQIAPDARLWVDFGSGGGFPGIVLACALADTPGAAVHLMERNAKKAAFLREALRVTGGSGVVYDRDIGDSVDSLPQHVDCVTARALAPLDTLLAFAEPLMARGARSLFLKGRDVGVEINDATRYWIFQPVLHESLTGDGTVVEIASLTRRGLPATPADC